MFRVDTSTAVAVIPAQNEEGTPGYFTKGNPSGGLAATVPGQDWYNIVQEELMAILTAAGVTPAKATTNQVLQAIKLLTNYAADTGAANAYAVAYSPALTAHVVGLPLRFKAANANTGASTLAVDGMPAVAVKRKDGTALQAADIPAGGMITVTHDGTYYQLENSVPPIAVLRNYIDGLTMSTAGSSATMAIAAGQAANSTNADMMSLASSINKTTSAWAVGTGNGGLDTGSIANSTWYHFFLIKRSDTGVVDVLISLSATAPTMPANYSYFRRIGSGKTDGSGKWVSFTQFGDYFRLKASVLDINDSSSGTSAKTGTLASVPTGIKVKALINSALMVGSQVTENYYISDLSANDEAPSVSAAPLSSYIITTQNAQTNGGGCNMEVMTNTSGQVRYRCNVSGQFYIATLGWTDYRGRND